MSYVLNATAVAPAPVLQFSQVATRVPVALVLVVAMMKIIALSLCDEPQHRFDPLRVCARL
jgi:hypothetical protein